MIGNAFAADDSAADPFHQHLSDLHTHLTDLRGGDSANSFAPVQMAANDTPGVLSDAGGGKAGSSTIDLMRRQIDQMQVPPLPTPEYQQQIMKGRKSQAEIDQGRRAIQDLTNAHNDAEAKRSSLINDLAKLEGQAQDKGKADAERDYNASWQGKAENIGKSYGPGVGGAIAGGAYGGVANSRLNKFQTGNARNLTGIAKTLDNVDYNTPVGRATAQGAVNAAEEFRPATGAAKAAGPLLRGAAYGLPAAGLLYESKRYNDQANDETVPAAQRENARLWSNMTLGGGVGIGMEGASRAVFPYRSQTMGPAVAKIETARNFLRDNPDPNAPEQNSLRTRAPRSLRAQTIDAEPMSQPAVEAQAPRPALPAPDQPDIAAPAAPTPAPVATPEAKPAAPAESAPRQHSDRLKEAARAADANGPLTKRGAVDHLLKEGSITEANRAAVARALNVKPGANFTKRILDTVNKMASKPGASGILAPLIAGGVAYDAATSDAQAGETAGDTRMRGARAAAEAAVPAAGAAYGLNALGRLVPKIGSAAGGALGVLGLQSAADAYDPTPEQLAMDRNAMVRLTPAWMHIGKLRQADEESQIPTPNPMRSR